MKADAICEVVIYRFDSFKKKILIDIGTIGIKLPFSSLLWFDSKIINLKILTPLL